MAHLSRALLLSVALLPISARAYVLDVGSLLTGADLPVPTDSMGDAGFDVLYDPETRVLQNHHPMAWFNLSSPLIAAHIHCCLGLWDSLPVAIDFVGIPPTTSGTYEYSFDLTLESSFGADFLAASGGTADAARSRLLTNHGRWFADIHTVDYPDGEIGGSFFV